MKEPDERVESKSPKRNSVKHNMEPRELFETCNFYIAKLKAIQKNLLKTKKKNLISQKPNKDDHL